MKKVLLVFSLILFAISSTLASDLIIDNFNDKALGTTYQSRSWRPGDATVTVVADPVSPANRVVNVVTRDWDAIMLLTVTLPAGRTLGEYTGFAFDMYIPTNAQDANANYKNMFIFLDAVNKYQDTNFPLQAPIASWTTKSYTLASLNLTAEESAKNTFTIAFGISTNNGNYFIDNVRLTGGPAGGGGGGGNVTTDFVMNFNTTALGNTFSLRAWNVSDGTATVAADPVNTNNRAVNVVTSNWDAFVMLNIVLPSGTTLANYESFSFDIYIPTNPQDANANHKNMFIFLDGVNKYQDTNFPLQAPIATWTTKVYSLAALNLTAAELAKSNFSLAFGISTNTGNYFIDNVKLTARSAQTNTTNPDASKLTVLVAGNTLHFGDMVVDRVTVFDLKGSVRATARNVYSLDVSMLSSGMFIIKTEMEGRVYVNKILK